MDRSPDLPTDCGQCDPMALNWGQEAASSPTTAGSGVLKIYSGCVNGGGGRMGSPKWQGHTQRTLPAPAREGGGGSLFLKNINVFICIITSLGTQLAGGWATGRGEKRTSGRKSERGRRAGVGDSLTGLRAGPGSGTARRGSGTAPGAQPPLPAAAGRSPSPGRPPVLISGSL